MISSYQPLHNTRSIVQLIHIYMDIENMQISCSTCVYTLK